MHYILFYEVVDDYLARRGAYRAEHLGLARAAVERGEMMMAGAFDEPADGAALIFRGDSPQAAEAFARNDPYVQNGLVKHWRVRKWNVVVGEGATPP